MRSRGTDVATRRAEEDEKEEQGFSYERKDEDEKEQKGCGYNKS